MSHVVRDIFNNAVLRRALFKSRFLLVLALLVPLAYTMQMRWFGPALALSMLGQLIQTWCFASLVKNRELTARGPYLLCRNPMYLGRFLLILGFVVLLGNVWVVLAYTVFYALYMFYRVKREETRLERVFGDDYRAYCNRVHRFWPTLRHLGNRDVWFFDWNVFRENNAHWNILGTLTAFGLLYALHRFL